MDFVHLHNHSDYSMLDGAIKVKDLIKRTKELGMKAVALTDHGNMFGAVEFYQKARAEGIQPVVGQEFYVAPGSRFKKEFVRDSGEEKAYHLIMLAENNEGYKNLMKLSSIGYVEGFYYKPRIDMESLEKYSKGIICSSACLAGEIPRYIVRGQTEKARQLAGRFYEIFGKDRFYLELQDHGIPEQKIVNRELIKMSADMNIPLIAANDCHYVTKDDYEAHEILLCIQTNRTINDPDRMSFSTNEFYIKSPEEMEVLFRDYPQALHNTVKIAEMTSGLEIDLGHPALPQFDVPEGYDLNTYMYHLAVEGAHRIYGETVPAEVQSRLDYEYSVISKMDFSGYFLIIWDFIKAAREKKIPVGPGRGSGAGSMIAYCLDITSIDPLRYDLLFERFLNPERNELPDMDLDFCSLRREEVIDYVKKKYGEDKVSQIITFNKMMAKGVVKDVARALSISYGRANEISRMIGDAGTLKEALETSKELQSVYNGIPEEKNLIDTSLKLEGLVRSAGKHAAGVVISRGVLTDYVPLYMDTREGAVTSQYEKNTLEQAGLVKMDFLALNNLTIIDNCLKLIKQTTGKELDLRNLALDDPDVFKLLQDADTVGVFQLEGSGMQNLLRRLGPTSIDDIIAVVALYRPGPLKAGMAEDFVIRKKDPSKVQYELPQLEPVLKDTLGVIVYQEQVMLISRVVGGFTMPEADKLRKAMGKKKPEVLAAMKDKFIKGAAAQNIDTEAARILYEEMEKFGEYGFNKSHSAAYAVVTYQTAYLKCHYYVEYLTALLSTDPTDVTVLINDCKKHGVPVIPPSINRSSYSFTIEKGKIRFGFSAVKGLGEKGVEGIIAEREKNGPFKSLQDFFERVDISSLNSRVLSSLFRAGAFDELNPNRAQLLASVDVLMESARKIQQDRGLGQGNLFDTMAAEDGSASSLQLLNVKPWSDDEKFENEKEALDLYLSGHPLDKYADEIKFYSSSSISSLRKAAESGRTDSMQVSIAGMVQGFEVKQSKSTKKNYGQGKFEDLGGTVEILVFSKILEKYRKILEMQTPVLIEGKVDFEENSLSRLVVSSVRPLEEVRREAISAIHIKLDITVGVDDVMLDELKDAFQRYSGPCSVYFHASSENSPEQVIKVHKVFNVNPCEELIRELYSLVGPECVRCSIGHRV